VAVTDILHPQKTAVRAVDDYVSETRPSIPAHLIRRFESFISTFKDTNGTYNGDDEPFIRQQAARLATCSFRLGADEIHLLLLLKKVGAYRFKGTPSERKR
jgi:hypothetical protein